MGDRVKVKFLLDFDDDIKLEYNYIGFIVDVNERWRAPGVQSSYLIEYKVKDTNNKNVSSGGWYEPKDIIPYSIEEEREDKLNSILNG